MQWDTISVNRALLQQNGTGIFGAFQKAPSGFAIK
jgi:hypothetical protein